MNASAQTGNAAFDLLLSIEAAVLLNGGAAPKNNDAREQWSGVRCLVAGMNFVVPLHQVAEILEPRSLTSIPGCAGWVRGLMNVRGRLLPVFGVSEFFKGARTRSASFQIILVEQGALFCGIAVDKVFGIQKFFQDDFSDTTTLPEGALDGIGAYISSFTNKGEDDWYQLDIGSLATRMSQANPAAAAANESRIEAPRLRPIAVSVETDTAATNAM